MKKRIVNALTATIVAAMLPFAGLPVMGEDYAIMEEAAEYAEDDAYIDTEETEEYIAEDSYTETEETEEYASDDEYTVPSLDEAVQDVEEYPAEDGEVNFSDPDDWDENDDNSYFEDIDDELLDDEYIAIDDTESTENPFDVLSDANSLPDDQILLANDEVALNAVSENIIYDNTWYTVIDNSVDGASDKVYTMIIKNNTYIDKTNWKPYAIGHNLYKYHNKQMRAKTAA